MRDEKKYVNPESGLQSAVEQRRKVRENQKVARIECFELSIEVLFL